MSNLKIIQSALISVFHKNGLKPIVEELHKNNVTIFSTGGTENFIKELGIPVSLSTVTWSIMEGFFQKEFAFFAADIVE